MHPEVIDPQIHRIDDEKVRREAWIQAISPVFMPTLDRDAPVPREAAFRCWNLGAILLSAIQASPQTIERTQSQIATQGVDHVILRLYNSGRSSLDTAAGDAKIAPGSFVLFDLSQRARSVSAGMTGINLCLPRRVFDPRVGEVSDLHRGLFEQRGQPLLRLLSDHMRNTRHCLDTSDTAQKALLASATVALCNAALTPASDSAHNRPAVTAIEIRQFIEANLSQSDLGVEALCARFGLSRTPIYALFEAEGGVMTYIRNRRLAQAMRILSGVEEGGSQRISGVAYACGYENLKSFSKAFHARYGVNPRDVDTAFRGEARRETGATLLSWIREL
ncbi:AraC-type DNA-binding protein [Methylorubrum populi]